MRADSTSVKEDTWACDKCGRDMRRMQNKWER